jgi:general secretion pathway protein K
MYTLQYAAEGGVNRAIYQLINSNQRAIDESHEKTVEYDLNGVSVSVLINSEAGKIDINQADETLLKSMFGWAGVSDESAKSLAQKTIDWRDEGSVKMPYGAEASDYVLGGYDYQPRNSNFQTVGELMQVMSVDRGVVTCLAPYLTVYTGQAQPYRKYAHENVSKIMGIAFDENGEKQLTGLLNQFRPGSNRVVSIYSTATKGQHSVSLRAVVRVTGNLQQPYYVHLWRLVDGRVDC